MQQRKMHLSPFLNNTNLENWVKIRKKIQQQKGKGFFHANLIEGGFCNFIVKTCGNNKDAKWATILISNLIEFLVDSLAAKKAMVASTQCLGE